jgi:hypothetical protein
MRGIKMGQFQWTDYIQLNVTDPAFESLVRQSLNQIASTPEGRDLIQRGFNNTQINRDKLKNYNALPSSGKIEISDNSPMNELVGSHAVTVLGAISLQKQQIGSIGIQQKDGTWHPMQLTHILVHELFHQTDPNIQATGRHTYDGFVSLSLIADASIQLTHPSENSEDDRMTKLQIYLSASEIRIKEAMPEFVNATKEQIEAYQKDPEVLKKLKEAMSRELTPEQANTYRDEIAKQLNIDPESFVFVSVSQSQLAQRAAEKGLIDPKTHAPVFEEAATDYTDAFMKKYFSEPPRVTYPSAQKLPADLFQDPQVYGFKCSATTPKLEYRNADLIDAKNLPTMSSIPCNGVAQESGLPSR